MNKKKIIIYSILFFIISGCSNNIFAENFINQTKTTNKITKKKRKKVYIIKRIYVITKDGKIIEKPEFPKSKNEQSEEKILFQDETYPSNQFQESQNKTVTLKKERENLLPEDNKTFYFDLFTGFTSLNYKLLGYNTLNTQPVYTDKLVAKNTNNAFAISFNAAFGTRVYKNYLRTELEGGMIYSFYNNATSTSGNKFGKADTQSFFVSWNWIADLPMSERFSVSLGAGVGGYFLSLKDLESIAAPGFKAIVGLNYRLTESAFLYVKYSPSFILFNDTISASKIIQTNNSGNIIGSYAKSDRIFIMNTIGIGIRYFFW